jgi:hypothetical protein
MWASRAGDLFEYADRRVNAPSLQPAHARPVNLRFERQILLRSASRHPQPAKIPGGEGLRLRPAAGQRRYRRAADA